MNTSEKLFSAPPRHLMKRILFTALVLAAMSFGLQAAGLNRAEVTIVKNDVRLVTPYQQERQARIKDIVSGQSVLNTGIKSRAELVFDDKTVARVGANASFSFQEGTRNMDLQRGTVLLQVPKGAGGATVKTAAVTAAVTGTTILIEHTPGKSVKAIVLEGTMRLHAPNNPGESILVKPGQMIFMDPSSNKIPEPVDVDLKTLVKSSKLVKLKSPSGGDGGGSGDNLDFTLIDGSISEQEQLKADGTLSMTTLLVVDDDVYEVNPDDLLPEDPEEAVIIQNDVVDDTKYSNAPLITTTTVGSIYEVTSSTQINTDPTIMTAGGVIDQGGFFNTNSSEQPAASQYLFGETRAFDTASGFNSNDASKGIDGDDVAVFHFTNDVSIEGSPIITVPAGSARIVGIVSDGSISTVGNYTYSMAQAGLGLVTKNSSFTLAGTTTFDLQGRNFLAYARGTGSDLNIYSSFINAYDTSEVEFLAEDTINIYNNDLDDIDHLRIYAGSGTTVDDVNIQGGNYVEIHGNLEFTGTGQLGANRIDAYNDLICNEIISPYVDCAGTIYSSSIGVQQLYCDSSLTIGAGGINAHVYANETTEHIIQATSIRSDGGIGTNFGGAANPNTNDGLHLSLYATASGLIFNNGPAAAETIVASGQIDFSGATGGNGGTLEATSYGDLYVRMGFDATPGTDGYAGGTVILTSETGQVNCDAPIYVGDATYQSGDGGLIRIESGRTSGTGLQIGEVSSSNQLLALTNAMSTNGSRIELLTSGANIEFTGTGTGTSTTTMASTGQTDAKNLNKIIFDATANGNLSVTGSSTGIKILSDIIKMQGYAVTINSTVLDAFNVQIYASYTLSMTNVEMPSATSIILASPNISLTTTTVSGAINSSNIQVYTNGTHVYHDGTNLNQSGTGTDVTAGAYNTAPTFSH